MAADNISRLGEISKTMGVGRKNKLSNQKQNPSRKLTGKNDGDGRRRMESKEEERGNSRGFLFIFSQKTDGIDWPSLDL